MAKQRVCIIGGGLSGLVTAIAFSRLNLNVDLIANNYYKNLKSPRTTAISDSNYVLLKKFNIINSSEKNLWPCSEIKLYDANGNLENKKIFNFNNDSKKNNILYMITNDKIIQIMKQKIKKNKQITIKSNTEISKLFSSDGLKYAKTQDKKLFKYNLIIICTGANSVLTKMFLGNRYFNHTYDEVSVVTIIDHDSIKNNIARQYFLKEGPLAFLPISNFQTSVIWSIKNNILQEQIKNREIFFKKFFKNLVKNIYKNIKFSSNIEYYDLNLHFSHKCFSDRVLLFGDALHSVHPLVGQGFNMILRDLSKLEKIISKQISLGLDIGSSEVLSEFVDNTKSNNFIYLTGIEIIKKVFSTNNIMLKNLRNYFLNQLNNNRATKSLCIKLADKGINL